MASVQSISKLFANAAIKLYDFDPDDSAQTEIAWVDMRDFTGFAAVFFRTVGTGALQTFKIVANSASNGSGTDVDIVAHAVAAEPNALGDQIFLECSAEQIRQAAEDAGVDARYVTVVAEFATTTDEGVIGYIRHGARIAKAGLTADIVA